ncbi:MAG: CPBP family intramembrane glutamic endopeptidase [Bacteroidales bacterium]
MLLQLMAKFSPFVSSFVLGIIWGLWHFPAYLIGSGVPQEMHFLVFLLWVVLGSLFIGWIYFNTQSVLTSILVHAGANASFHFLNLLPEFTGSMEPFWFFLLYVTGCLMLVFSFKGKGFFYRDNTK